jgi:excisionase family DNA binding protein
MTGGRHDSRDTRDQERLISVKEAAQILGVSERTIRRKIAANELPSVKSGTARLIPDGAVTLSSRDDTTDTAMSPAVMTTTSVDLSPLTAVIERQAAEIARLHSELATAHERLRMIDDGGQRHDRDVQELRAEVEPLKANVGPQEASPDGQGGAESPKTSADTLQVDARSWWRRLLGME